MIRTNFKKLFFTLAFSVVAAVGWANELSLGVQYQNWSLNSAFPYGGSEIWAPFAMNFKVNDDISLFGQGEFGHGNYTDSPNGVTNTVNLTAFSDLVLGGELKFKSFSLPSVLNIGFNVPSGDTSWESKQIPANLPTEFVDSRYRGRGFGVNAMYGFSMPLGNGEIGVAGGYAYTGAFNPNYGIGPQSLPLKLGDSVFIALNHYQPFSNNQNQVIRASVYQSLPTQQGGQDIFQMGTNFNASYNWVNPAAFSFELGGQVWLAARRPDLTNNGSLAAEPNLSFGPRAYLNASYAFGDFAVAGRAKYILANGYSVSVAPTFYDGGGYLLGIEPSYLWKVESDSAIRFFGSYDFITALNMGVDVTSGQPTNLYYNRFVLGATYLLKF